MKKIAEVVINSRIKSLDKTFHYLADETVCEGMRVEVPFGNANLKQIGYVTGFAEKSEFDNLKEIIRPIDSAPMLSKEAIELARHIKRTCLCPMSEAVRLLIPPNIKTRFERIVTLAEEATLQDLTDKQKIITDTLAVAPSGVEITDLKNMCGFKNTAPITALAKKNVIRITEALVGNPTEKTRKFAVLTCEDTDEALEDLRRNAKTAATAFEIIAEHEKIPIADVLSMAGCSMPSVILLEKRGYIEIETETVYRTPVSPEKRSERLCPTPEQEKALNEIYSSMQQDKSSVILLHGVTGSGKTEVFLQAAQRCIEQGRNVIILVPEIALTPQMTERFVGRFGENIALLHSGLSMGERYDQWRKIKNGQVKVAVGARSAVFAPFDNVGLIVVDEEHETSYRSEVSPRYSAKNIALMRGRQYNATVILASATPSLETYFGATRGKYKLLELTSRHNNGSLPQVETVDMTEEFNHGNKTVISKRLAEEIADNLNRGEQTILFLNRRGYSTFVSCRNCGYTVKCPHCDVTLTYHSRGDRLSCHYCGYSEKNINVCPQCGSIYIKYFGSGTQRAEEDLKQIFPGISVLRMDADTTTKKLSHQRIFKKFREENIDILLGTQMVAKGLDFPTVTLVGVLSADVLLNKSDFRAAEYAFSQLTQVCGRAGRGDKPGRAIIQTYNPASDVIKMAQAQDYKRFYEEEIKLRYMLGNPPFVKLVNIIFSGDSLTDTQSCARKTEELLRQLCDKQEGLCRELYGAMAAPIEKIKNKYRYRILIKFSATEKMLDVLEYVNEKHLKSKSRVKMDIVINPTSVL